MHQGLNFGVRNALKLTYEHLAVKKIFPGATPPGPQGEGRGGEGGTEGGEGGGRKGGRGGDPGPPLTKKPAYAAVICHVTCILPVCVYMLARISIIKYIFILCIFIVLSGLNYRESTHGLNLKYKVIA
jgi:hypothetical protein